MSIKPESTAATEEVWSGGVLEVEGRDAGVFLQAQLMNDLRALAVGDWQWTGWLNAKGRVIALAALVRRSELAYWLILPDYSAARLAEDLRRFVFRSKLTLIVRDDLGLRGLWERDAVSPEPIASLSNRNDPVLVRFGGERPRLLQVAAKSADTPGAASATAWAVEDLAHGLPRLTDAAVATHTPQMLGLERLRAYSVKKGCYPGQEIVARTHFLGQAKRGLRRLLTPQALPRGTALFADSLMAGEVLCSASHDRRHEALAVLPLTTSGELRVGPDGPASRVIEFAEGLAR